MFGSRASGKAALIADIDDCSVGVSVVELAKKGPPGVVLSERMTLPIEGRSKDQSAAGVLQLLEQCVDKVVKTHTEGGKNPAPRQLYAIVRTPWTRFRTAQTDAAFPEARTITKEVTAEFAKKAISSITDIDTANVLEAGVMQVFLNGYPTGNPLGKKAQTIAVTAFESDIDSDMKRGIVEVFGKLLPGRTPVIHSGMRALLILLHEVIPDIHRYCLLSVAGTATSCAIIRKEMLTQSSEASEGAASIVRRVTGTGLPEETVAQLRMLASDTCSTDACKATRDALARAEPELAKVYGEMFAKLAQYRRLPNKCVLFAPMELAPWLQGFFERIDFAQFTATQQPLNVEPLTPEHLNNAVAWKTGAPQDTGIAIGAGYVNILEQSA